MNPHSTHRQLDEDWELPVDSMATQQQTVSVCGLGGQQHRQNVVKLLRARDIPHRAWRELEEEVELKEEV